MKAVINDRYGGPDVLTLGERPMPDCGAGELLIRIAASSVSRTDVATLAGKPKAARVVTGLFGPKSTVLGLDFAGVVEESRSERFAPGDRVFGMSPGQYGAHAEYLVVAADGPVATIPDGIGFDQSVLCEGGWYAHSVLEALGVGEGFRLLVFGGGGAVGSAAIQIAKARGARVVAAVEPHQIDLASGLGADLAIDSRTLDELPEEFDGVLDAIGKLRFRRVRAKLTYTGRFASTDFGPGGEVLRLALFYTLAGRRGRVMLPMPRDADAIPSMLSELMAEGRYRAVIDRSYPMDRVREAYEYAATGTKTGIVVLDIPG
ncbi:NAD(P)-dependent alcohol dehydrogenase [Pelagovum pacificum]|uniref:NAD(P)-dependent alcohol dehydrogenase n=1 Tax=Pelagovum pacificum TaxID=2588711 RepID=A0A5C5GCK9_9RHOB|nr:NAD(P)-dependent alcohol dehydrogenase [Pelagovum pacificum]QQA41310.1 NAD(P)-dependent alcohol dehydrogenase [Pelagovum pacificum]TNY31884.1 NAD(P)-dependent alcohol dehydrogenase [Pelagovum pacificum]